MTIKSWYYMQVSYLRQVTSWRYPFSVYQRIWAILGAFRRSKEGKKCVKKIRIYLVPICLEMSVNCWNCSQVSYFRRETFILSILYTRGVFRTRSNIYDGVFFSKIAKKLHLRCSTEFEICLWIHYTNGPNLPGFSGVGESHIIPLQFS